MDRDVDTPRLQGMEIGVPGVRGVRAAMGLVTKPDDGTATILLQPMAGEIAGALA